MVLLAWHVFAGWPWWATLLFILDFLLMVWMVTAEFWSLVSLALALLTELDFHRYFVTLWMVVWRGVLRHL